MISLRVDKSLCKLDKLKNIPDVLINIINEYYSYSIAHPCSLEIKQSRNLIEMKQIGERNVNKMVTEYALYFDKVKNFQKEYKYVHSHLYSSLTAIRFFGDGEEAESFYRHEMDGSRPFIERNWNYYKIHLKIEKIKEKKENGICIII